MRQRAIVLGVLAAGGAAGIYSLAVARGTPAYSFAGTSPAGDAALLAAGFALVASGAAFGAWRPGSLAGPLLAAAGFAWFLPEWNNPGAGSALAFTTGLCLSATCAPLVAHAALAYPGGTLFRRIERGTIAASYAGGVLVLGIVPALFSNPAAAGCNDCPRNLVLVAGRDGLARDVTRVGVYAGLAWASALAALMLAALFRATTARQPVLAAGAVYSALVAATFAASLDRSFLSTGTLERRLWLGEAAALVGVACAVGWGRLRLRRARAAVARLVVELAHSPPPGGLRRLLATIVGDPELLLAYPLAHSTGLVDAEGRPVDPSARPARTSLVRNGRSVAVLLHARDLLDDEQLVDEVAAAASLALENERLQAEVRARVEELRASRARIVAAGDLERKRLERNLHDGAQQRLVALSLSLRLLRSQLPSDALRQAETELDEAILELRELAHGIFPAVLADAGLAVAVDALAEEGHVGIVVGPLPQGRFPPAIETAAYTVVAEAARTASGDIAVRGEERRGTLVVEVETDGDRGLDVVALEDRLGALEGRLAVEERTNGRVTIRAELPCAS